MRSLHFSGENVSCACPVLMQKPDTELGCCQGISLRLPRYSDRVYRYLLTVKESSQIDSVISLNSVDVNEKIDHIRRRNTCYSTP